MDRLLLLSRRRQQSRTRRWALVLALTAILGAACSSAAPTRPAEYSGVIHLGAPPEALAFAIDVAETYAQGASQLSVEPRDIPSAEAIAAVRSGSLTVAVVNSNAPGKPTGLEQTELARQPISFIVHATNRVRNLSTEQLSDLYTGRTPTWDQVGGEAMPVMVLTREQSAMRSRIESSLLAPGWRVSPNALVLPSDEAMIATVSRRPEAIGFIAGALHIEGIRLLSINGEQPAAVARGRAYPFWQSIVMITRAPMSPELADLVRYVRSRQGQRLVISWGYGQGSSAP